MEPARSCGVTAVCACGACLYHGYTGAAVQAWRCKDHHARRFVLAAMGADKLTRRSVPLSFVDRRGLYTAVVPDSLRMRRAAGRACMVHGGWRLRRSFERGA